MEGASIDQALGRIEAALSRIEQAAETDARPDRELAERHERLREAVGQSLQQLDALIAGQPR